MGRTLRKRYFAKICANDEDGSSTAPIPLFLAKAYSELRRSLISKFSLKFADIFLFFLIKIGVDTAENEPFKIC